MKVVEFLLARIAEDEEIAREATNDGHRWLVEEEAIGLWPDDLEPATGYKHFPRKAHAYHAATWEPSRVLAECRAKRDVVAFARHLPSIYARSVLEPLTFPHSNHPDFQKEWQW